MPKKKTPKLCRLEAMLNQHAGYPEGTRITANEKRGDCDFELLEAARADFADVIKECDEQRARAERSEAAHIEERRVLDKNADTAAIKIAQLTSRIVELKAKET